MGACRDGHVWVDAESRYTRTVGLATVGMPTREFGAPLAQLVEQLTLNQ
jgi:hypothetical protein